MTDGSTERDELSDKNIGLLHAIVTRISKHQPMENVRDGENCFEMFDEGNWGGYLEYVNDRLEHTLMCESCEQPYDEQYSCVCGGTETLEWSFA